jgi:hypothetical protein
MDPEEYENIFGYLSDKKYPNDRKIHCSVILICRMIILIMMMLSKQSLLCANQNEINQLKDSHSFMTMIKYKKMKVNHGGEV